MIIAAQLVFMLVALAIIGNPYLFKREFRIRNLEIQFVQIKVFIGVRGGKINNLQLIMC